MIKKQRISIGFTQEIVAQKLGISLRHYQNIENFKTKPNIIIGLKLALILKCDPYLLFNIKE